MASRQFRTTFFLTQTLREENKVDDSELLALYKQKIRMQATCITWSSCKQTDFLIADFVVTATIDCNNIMLWTHFVM